MIRAMLLCCLLLAPAWAAGASPPAAQGSPAVDVRQVDAAYQAMMKRLSDGRYALSRKEPLDLDTLRQWQQDQARQSQRLDQQYGLTLSRDITDKLRALEAQRRLHEEAARKADAQGATRLALLATARHAYCLDLGLKALLDEVIRHHGLPIPHPSVDETPCTTHD